MSPEIGQWALILALLAAITQCVLPALGFWRRDRALVDVAHSGATVVFVLVVIAYLCLSWSFVENDFSVIYVASNSHSELPLMYRLSAVWGGHEGSLLLWLLMLAGWAFAVSRFNRHLPADVAATALAVLGFVSVGFLLFTIGTSNPFDRQFPVPTVDEGHHLHHARPAEVHQRVHRGSDRPARVHDVVDQNHHALVDGRRHFGHA